MEEHVKMRKNRLLGLFALVLLLAVGGCGQGSLSESAVTEGDGGNAAAQAPARAAAPRPQPIVVPAGTAIEITVDQSVSSKTNNAGDRFVASLAAPVLVNGRQVIPAGASASGTVTVSKSAGRFSGNAELALTLDSVTVDGKTYDLQTSTFSETTEGRGKRTAIGTGVGAAAGAVIGAIAGGGKGAAIGAGAGAGAGTAGAALTGDRDVTFPAETRINFELSQPVSIQPLS
jgi:hypothetical protein